MVLKKFKFAYQKRSDPRRKIWLGLEIRLSGSRASLACTKDPPGSSVPNKPGMVADHCNPSPWEIGARGSVVPSHIALYSKFKATQLNEIMSQKKTYIEITGTKKSV